MYLSHTMLMVFILRRVIKSEMAYSETQGLLDQTKTRLQNLQDECKIWVCCNDHVQ